MITVTVEKKSLLSGDEYRVIVSGSGEATVYGGTKGWTLDRAYGFTDGYVSALKERAPSVSVSVVFDIA